MVRAKRGSIVHSLRPYLALLHRLLMLCSSLLALRAEADAASPSPPLQYHDVAFQRDTGAVVIREGERLLHISPEGVIEQLPPFRALESRIQLLTLSDGLWIRDGSRFAYLRPRNGRWAHGRWLSARPLSARQLRHHSVYHLFEHSPLLAGPRQQSHLRLRATEQAIEAVELTRAQLASEPPFTRVESEVRHDPSQQRCLVERKTPDGVVSTWTLPERTAAERIPCSGLQVETWGGRLWVRSGDLLLAEQEGGFWTLSRGSERPAPVSADSPRYVSNEPFDKLAPWLGVLALGALIATGAFATKDASRRVAFSRALATTIATAPSIALLHASQRVSGGHDFSVLLYVPAALLLSPLPALSAALAGHVAEDGANRRGRAIAASFAATLASATLVLPLTRSIGDSSEPKRQLLANLLAVGMIGLAASLGYAYTANLQRTR